MRALLQKFSIHSSCFCSTYIHKFSLRFGAALTFDLSNHFIPSPNIFLRPGYGGIGHVFMIDMIGGCLMFLFLCLICVVALLLRFLVGLVERKGERGEKNG